VGPSLPVREIGDDDVCRRECGSESYHRSSVLRRAICSIQMVGDLKTDETLADQARNNTMDQFRYAFDPKAMATFLGWMERNQEISAQFMANKELRKVALEWMMRQVFSHFQGSMFPDRS
jgi:hypothetical protein